MDYIHDRAARAVSEQLPKKSGNSANIMVAPAKKATLEAPQAPRGMGAKETQNVSSSSLLQTNSALTEL